MKILRQWHCPTAHHLTCFSGPFAHSLKYTSHFVISENLIETARNRRKTMHDTGGLPADTATSATTTHAVDAAPVSSVFKDSR